LTNNIQANDTWAFYQAKSIKQSLYEIAALDIETQLQTAPNLTQEQRRALQERLDRYKATIARYESDPVTGEGKRELAARAHRLEEERDISRQKSPWFSFASAFLQIAIVLSSTAILAVSMELLWASVGFGAFGLMMFLNGLLLFARWPF
jgi:ABC-type multidrug transport system fused ATPase/permease subunit